MPNGIAQALGGFSAGLQGQGAQYSAMLDQREMLDREKRMQNEALSKDRLTAMVKDSYGVKTLLESGKTDAALKLLKNRIEHINKLGGDPTDTKAVYDQLVSGDPTQFAAAQKTLTDVVDAGVAGGLWAPPQESLESKKFTFEQDKFRQEQELAKRVQDWKEANPNAGVMRNDQSSANIREIEYYNRMPDGPAKEAAGRKLGLMPNWGYDAENARAVAEAKAAGGVAGKGQAEAAIDLPKIESSSAKVTSLVNELLNHKGKSAALGASSYLPSIRGTERAGFDNRLKQIQGDAFLKAFESLKGGGAITEMEGQKATQALNRMNETVNEEEFDAAAKDFISEVNRFKEIAAQRAKGTSPTQSSGIQGGAETAAQRLARLTGGK